MNSEILSQLEYFGLDEIDSKIYAGLLQLGPVSVGKMAAKLEIDRGKAYRSLGRLKKLGIVSTTFSNPTICSAVSPFEALNTIIQIKQDEIITMKNLASKILENLKNMSRICEPATSSSLSIIQGRTNIYSRIGKLIENSTKTLFIVTTVEDLIMMYHTSIPEKIKIAKKNGAEVLIITQTDIHNSFLMYKMPASEIRFGNLPSKSRIIVESGKVLLMSGAISDNVNLKDENDSVLLTNSPEMISNMFNLCSLLWKKSKKVEIPTIKQRR